ncbi:autotransporter-associated beta strand repeat-containing protein [Chelativorans sp.]|uniref:autotransporter-associated beta strand repeat-containing protein n=1 Tax=Chelativorans sp. TaxID=2203393 RepID=UPI002811B4F1|nr:autotransporter-associated beta strand repeat-containing protein [Chelativorans sp.]
MTKWKGEAASFAPNLAHFVSASAGRVLAAGLLAALTASSAIAADRYWDANGTGSGYGGTGVWNLSNLNWSPNSDGVSGPYNQAWNNNGIVPGTPDNAIFGGTAGTVTLGAPITVNSITFTANGYTIAGAGANILTIAGGTPTVTTNAGVGATISAGIQTSAGFTKAGVGVLTLSGANNFGTGALNVNAGTLTLSGSNTFTGNVNVSTGTSLTLSAANTFTGNINVSGALGVSSNAALGAAGNTVTLNGGSLSSVGALNAGRQVIINGSATIGGTGVGSALFTGSGNLEVLSGVSMTNNANTYTGTTTLWGSGAANVTVWFTSVRNTGEASALGSGGDIVLQGVNSFNDNFSYTGDGDTTDRTFRFTPGTNASVALGNNGTGTLAFTGSVSLEGGARGIIISATSADIDFSSGIISGASASTLTLTGGAARTITLGGANTFSTGVTITTATVVASTLADIGSNSSLGTGSADSQIHINNGTLRYTGDGDDTNRTWQVSGASAALQNDGSGGLGLSGAVVLNSGALNLRGSYGGLNTLSGNMTGAGGVTMNGAGTWLLSGTNDFAGPVTVQNGTLRAGSATALGTSGAATINGGMLDLAGYSNTFTRLDGTGGEVALGGANMTLDIANGITATYSGSITGSGSLTKTGAGRQILRGANTYTGATNVAIGTLELSFAGAGGPTSDIISSSSTLNMSGGTLAVTGVSGEGNTQTFDGLNITGGTNRITATNATVNFGPVNRTAGIIDFGIGTGTVMTVAPGTTLGGWATVTTGTATDYADVNASNQIVAFTAYDLKDNAATWIDGDIVADTAGAANSPFFGTASDAGGDNIVQLGGLRYAAAPAAGSVVTVGAGQTLGIDGTIIVGASVGATTQTIQNGSVRGTAGGVLGIQQNSIGTFSINSTIVDNAGPTGLTVAGSGTGAGTGKVVLGNAANTYTGGTLISRTTLEVGTLANGGVASSIGMSSADPANLVLEAGRLSYTGGTASTDRGMTLTRSGALADNIINVTQVGANLTVGGELISPDGANLIKEGAGTLTLTNANSSYAGTTTISAGTLAVTSLGNGGANSTIGSSSSDSANLFIANGAEFQYDGVTATSDRGFTLGTGSAGVGFDVSSVGSVLTMTGDAVGVNSLVKRGAGTLVLSGNNTYRGNTVEAGTLRAGSTTAFGGTSYLMQVNAGGRLELATFSNTVGGLAGAGTVHLGAAGTTLTLSGQTAAFTGTITGTGGLTVSNTQTLNGCNHNYTGPTTISGGTLIADCIRNGGTASSIGASPNTSSSLVLASSGVLQYTGGDVATDRGFTLSSGWGYFDVTQAATELEFEGTVTGGGSLAKRGPGTLILSGTNTYTGSTSVEAGTLIAGSASAFGAGYLSISAGATVDTTGFNNTIYGLGDNSTAGGQILIADKTLTLSDGGSATFAGRITGTTGRLVKNGGGTQILTGCDNSYGGGTTINSGWLVVNCLADGGVNSSIGRSSADAANLVIGAAGLHYQGDGDTTNRGFTMSAFDSYIRNHGTGALEFTSTAAVAYSGAGTRRLRLLGSNTDTNIMAAHIGNNGASATHFVKDEAGTWRLTSTTSNYTGPTSINGGVLEVTKLADGNSASSIGASTAIAGNLVINTESHLRYVGSGDSTNRLFTLGNGASYIESSGTGAINFTDSGGLMGFAGGGPRTMVLGGTYTGDNIMGVTIRDLNATTGQTTLAKHGEGTWILTANNTYTGNTVIDAGKLIIGNGGTTGNVGTGPVILAFDTGTLGFNRSDTVNFAGQISGPGTIEQMGEGTTNLTAVNSAGVTKISEGTLQVSGALTTDTIVFEDDETTTLTVNGTVQGNGLPATITGDASANIINVNTGGTLTAVGDLGGGSDTITLAGTLNTGAGTLSLGSGNDTLTLNDGGVIGGSVTGGTGTDTLQVNNSGAVTLAGGSFSEFESLNKTLGGILTLTGSHSYSAGATIAAGTLQIGNGATAGALATPTVANSGILAFNMNSNYTFAGAISGSGQVTKLGSGVTTLTGTSTYTGATNVNEGTLLINGDQSGANGLTSVASGATLGGTGTIGGSVSVADGGILSPGAAGNAPGRLAIKGGLALNDGSIVNVNFGQANVAGGPLNDLIQVGGHLTLDGTLNITETPGGDFGPGVYRIFNYGTMTNNGLDVASPDYFVQTSVANQVNLVNSAGLALSYWDGDAGPHSNGAVNGGNGTWRAAGDQNWTDETGTFAAPFANASFAIFQATAGTVEVDDTNGPVQALGMQFATSAYVVRGDGIELLDDSTQAGLQSVIRVGDGTLAGAGYVASIESALSGATQLVKTDLGTLVLSGTNTYTGGTAINGGTVEIFADANLGAAGGALSLNGGTLRNNLAVTSSRAVTLNAGGGTFETLDTLTLNGAVGGTGVLTKTGAGTLVLSGANTYQGGTIINAGTVAVSANANLGDASGALTFNGGTLHSTGTFTAARHVTLNAGGGTFDTDGGTALTLANAVVGAGALTKDGTGTLVLANTNTYGGGTTISGGTLQLGNGGGSGSIMGGVLNSGTFAFNRNNSYSFDGLIEGSGSVEQIGSGVTILTADNTYSGETRVREGTLIVNGDQSAAGGATTVEDGGTLGGTGTIGGDVSVLDGGSLSPGNVGAAPGTLTIDGHLTLAENATLNYNFGQAGVVGGAYNDLTIVRGDLVLDGTINVTETPGGSFGPGIYRIISYTGGFTNQGLSENSANHVVQTSIDGQVNLVEISAMTLNFWDGDVGTKGEFVDGGSGTWRAAGDDNWTEEVGDVNAAFTNGSFAIFAGADGEVEVDNDNGQVRAAGMQFATPGYRIWGDAIELEGPQATMRVGDGTAPGAAYVATIESVLSGDAQIVKRDLGTLVLAGNNTYTGGTFIDEGTVQISSDANLGDAAGALILDGGALRNTGALTSARNITLNAAGGTFLTDEDATLSGIIGGAGGLVKSGAAALTLTGNNIYAGPTTVTAGSLYVEGNQGGADGLTSVLSGATLGGGGRIGGDVTIADGATLTPGAADGTPGTLAIDGNLALSGGSILNYSFGQANVEGGTLNDFITVGGNLVLDGTLNVTETPGGTFGPGIYRIFSYNGTLTNNGLTVGAIPSSGYFVQTAIANQVNLVNTDGLVLNYWDGAAGRKFDSVIQGGDGVWQNSAGNDNWADGTGMINAPYTDGSFAIFSGQAGTVTVDNDLGQVTASGMQFTTDGYVIEGGPLGLDGPQSTIRVGDGSSAGAAMTATIEANLTGGSQLVKTDQGTLVLAGTNSYTGGTAVNGGTLQISSDANLGEARGAVSLSGGTLRTSANFASARALNFLSDSAVFTEEDTSLTWNGVLSGSGSFTKDGAGTMTVDADSSAFAGSTSVNDGTLAVTGSLCGDINVRAGGRLQGTGTVCDTNNFAGGTVAPGNSIGTLTVDGDYTGSGGMLEIETVLGGDASPTDRLVVTGDTSGTSSVKVVNLGGGGAQTVEGIKIVDVAGASNGTFALDGDYVFEGEQAVVGGAYAYRLYKGGVSTPADGDWYLRSAHLHPGNPDPQPLYAPGVPLYEAYAGVLQSFNELGTLQQRVGNRSWGSSATPQGADVPDAGPIDSKAIWARIEAAHTEFAPETSTTGADYDAAVWKLQAGVDGPVRETDAGVLIGGITVHYGTVTSDVSSVFGAGSIDATGYGFGGTLTWYGNSGFYADAQAQVTWYDTDLTSSTLGTTLADGNDGAGYAFSLEAGQRIAFGDRWSVTPQAQLGYSAVDFDDFTDPYGAAVALQDSDTLTGRIGMSVDYENQWVDSAGQVSRAHVYGIANLYYDFLEGSEVDVSGTRFDSEKPALWGGIGLGASLSWADGRYAVFGNAKLNGALEDIADNYSLGGTLGLRVSW